MAEKKRKRIHNPRTGHYYAIRQKNTSKGKTGQIMGLYKQPKKTDSHPLEDF
jgi:hypothetical protein